VVSSTVTVTDLATQREYRLAMPRPAMGLACAAYRFVVWTQRVVYAFEWRSGGPVRIFSLGLPLASWWLSLACDLTGTRLVVVVKDLQVRSCTVVDIDFLPGRATAMTSLPCGLKWTNG
jgi:hypothetical protein